MDDDQPVIEYEQELADSPLGRYKLHSQSWSRDGLTGDERQKKDYGPYPPDVCFSLPRGLTTYHRQLFSELKLKISHYGQTMTSAQLNRTLNNVVKSQLQDVVTEFMLPDVVLHLSVKDKAVQLSQRKHYDNTVSEQNSVVLHWKQIIDFVFKTAGFMEIIRAGNCNAWHQRAMIDLGEGCLFNVHPRVGLNMQSSAMGVLEKRTVGGAEKTVTEGFVTISLYDFVDVFKILSLHKLFFAEYNEDIEILDVPCEFTHVDCVAKLKCQHCNYLGLKLAQRSWFGTI